MRQPTSQIQDNTENSFVLEMWISVPALRWRNALVTSWNTLVMNNFLRYESRLVIIVNALKNCEALQWSVLSRPSGWLRVLHGKKTLTLRFPRIPCDMCLSLHAGNNHLASPVYTTFSNRDHIARSQQCQTVLTGKCSYPIKLGLCMIVDIFSY